MIQNHYYVTDVSIFLFRRPGLFFFTPVSFQFEAATQGMVIYEKSTRAKFDYLEEVMKKHADLKFFYDLRHNAILERI